MDDAPGFKTNNREKSWLPDLWLNGVQLVACGINNTKYLNEYMFNIIVLHLKN